GWNAAAWSSAASKSAGKTKFLTPWAAHQLKIATASCLPLTADGVEMSAADWPHNHRVISIPTGLPAAGTSGLRRASNRPQWGRSRFARHAGHPPQATTTGRSNVGDE